VSAVAVRRGRRRRPRPRFLRSASGVIGLALLSAALFAIVFGPLLAPHGPSDIIGPPFAAPGGAYPLGTDFLGRDVLTRLLYGGRTVLLLGGTATLIAYVIGGAIGLLCGYLRGAVDAVLMRAMDVLLAFPPLLFLLILATGAGGGALPAVAGVAAVQVPGIARIIRAATLEVSGRGYVEAASIRGERTSYVLTREIVPNIASTIVADGGPRLTVSILAIASLTFLGVGVQPPTADWALMMTENRSGLTFQPWAVIAPALALAVLTVGVNLFADSVARGLSHSTDATLMRR
jgi:ABC-type dipeptide/oligopeptide/nickel transport system permease subunit